MSNKSNKNLILIVGKPASGKSYMAEQLRKKGYSLISTDEVIREKLIPKYRNKVAEDRRLFRVYREGNMGPVIEAARRDFIRILKWQIKKLQSEGHKIVVEGTIMHNGMIREIFGDEFTLCFIRPRNMESYVERVRKRFKSAPDTYGRLGFLKVQDKDGSALEDYKKNGINGEIIGPFIRKIAEEEYNQIQEWLDVYKDFNVDIIIN